MRCVTTGLVLVIGEVTTNAYVDIQKVVRDTISEIGYTSDNEGLNANTCGILVSLDEQSVDIAQSVNTALESRLGENIEKLGVKDQGMMFGYATNETLEYMPYSISMAHKITKQLSIVRKKEFCHILDLMENHK